MIDPIGQPGERGQSVGEGAGAAFQMFPFQLDLGLCQLCLQKFAQGVDASLGSLLLDCYKPLGKALLLARGLQFPAHCI